MPTLEFAPLFWWGLPLVAAPVLIHLINLLRQRRVKWAAMEFLLASQRRYRTRVLLRQIALLALRTLAVLGLVAALAQPRWRSAGGIAGGDATTHLVILDDSCSMGDTTGDESDLETDAAAGDTRRATAFDRGRRVVERIAADLAATAGRHRLAVAVTSQLATSSDVLSPLLPLLPFTDIAPGTIQTVRDAVGRAAAGDGAAGLREACPAMRRLAAAAGGRRVVWLVGDFRSRDWLGSDEPAATLRQLAVDGATLRLVDCASDGPAGNLTLERLEVVGGVPAANVLLPVDVEARNDGSTSVRDVAIELREDGGGRPGVRIDEIPAGGMVSRRFDVRFTVPGSHTIEAALPGDVLKADDGRQTVIEVVDRVDVLVVDGAPDAASGAGAGSSGDGFYVATALAPGAGAATGLRPRVVPPAALAVTDLSRFACLWILDVERLDAAAVAAVEAYARAGGGVVFFCGPRTRGDVVNDTLHRSGAGLFPVPLAGAIDLLSDAKAAAQTPDVTVEDHPVVAVLAGQRNPLLDAVRIERFWAIDRGFDAAGHGVRRLLSLRTGQPLVIEKTFGDGLVVAVLTTAAPEWNNWARANPSWVVVLLELEGHLARLRRRAESVTVGEPVTVRLEAGVDEPDVHFLVPPDAAVVRQTAVATSGPMLEAMLPATAHAGLVEARWRRLDGSERQRSFAVNVDPGEGRLERAGVGRLEAALRGVPFRYDRAADVAATAGDFAGRPLALPLLIVVAALLLLEQLVAYAAGYHPVARRPTA
jgi:hypothetical protein